MQVEICVLIEVAGCLHKVGLYDMKYSENPLEVNDRKRMKIRVLSEK
jgi:hypothetical protein